MVEDFFHQQSVAYQPAHLHHLTNRGPNLDLWLVHIWQSFPGAKSLKELHDGFNFTINPGLIYLQFTVSLS